VVTDTDRDKYGVRRIIDFYQRQTDRLCRLFPGRLALPAPQGRSANLRRQLADVAAQAKVSPNYLATILGHLDGKARASRPDRGAAGAVE